MKEEQTVPEKLIVIDVHLNRGLVIALSCIVVMAALVSFLALAGGIASAAESVTAPAASTGMRQYYLTEVSSAVQGDEALNACEELYHMASLWEIADPSNLEYNTELGLVANDGGQGPPTNNNGWVRTGYGSDTSNVPGRGNCAIWTSDDGTHYGTVVALPETWTAGSDDLGVWTASVLECNLSARVWCIED